MAQSKLKQLEHMVPIEAPESYDLRTFKADFEPLDAGVKDMLEVENLAVGYDKILSTVNLKVEKGDKIGIIGGNGLGKSTFIRTLMGDVKAISGRYNFSSRASIGYFDQQMAQYESDSTVLDDFMNEFPSLTEFEARSALGAFLFSGEDVFKTVNVLSGGERVRLALCKIFKRRPNFLILDEPTNHMDIVGKETLEEMLSGFSGTVIFVSHDRYFIKKISTKVLDFKSGETVLYNYGYEQYLEKQNSSKVNESVATEKPIKEKKTYTTPAKEKSRLERGVKKAEEKIALLEEKLDGVMAELLLDENLSDYIKLSELQKEQEELEIELDIVMTEWERLSEELAALV